VDLSVGASLIQTFAQPVDMDGDCIRLGLVVNPIELFLKNGTRHDPALAAQELLEERNLPAGQRDRVSFNAKVPPNRIECDVAGRQHDPEGTSRPPQKRFDARDQLGHGKRFDKIIVRARIETGDAVFDGVARCQHQNRNGVAAAPYVQAKLQAVAIRKPEIQDERIIRKIGERLGGIALTCTKVDGKASLSQTFPKHLPKPEIVLYDKNTHNATAPFPRPEANSEASGILRQDDIVNAFDEFGHFECAAACQSISVRCKNIKINAALYKFFFAIMGHDYMHTSPFE
jgi:hypothetical protein